MKFKAALLMAALVLTAALVGGCATEPQVVSMQTAGGEQKVTIPESRWTGTASGEQLNAVAREVQESNNANMRRFDKLDGQTAKLQNIGENNLAKLVKLSNEQGTGQITLFFKTGSSKLDSSQIHRLINFLDYLSVASRGRKVILVSIGSASGPVGKIKETKHLAEENKKLSMQRAEAPRATIEQFLLNIPHEFNKVIGVGDTYAPKGASKEVEERYQNVRIIAVYDTADIPAIPGVTK